jgi:4,5-DOPA dioxygenase extradiol
MRHPALFLGHGNPMITLEGNSYASVWQGLGRQLPAPQAIVAVSAHWYVSGTRVTANRFPDTIHDFEGFPQKLYEIQYPAPGNPILARRLQSILKPLSVELDESWGLDHGAWSVLRHLYPDARIPVIQLSVDEQRLASFHFELGRRLAPLRDEGILILGSGNLVHNLQRYQWGTNTSAPFDWAARFEMTARELISAGEFEPLIEYEKLGTDASLSIPTPDHYLPLLYVLGTRELGEPIAFPVEGFDGGSMSMLAVQIG